MATQMFNTPTGGYMTITQRDPSSQLLELLTSGGRIAQEHRNEFYKNLGDLSRALGGGFASSSASGSGGAGAGGGYKELSDSLLGQMANYGDSRREAINRAYDTSLDSSLARLYDRGFGNSSLVETTQQASDRNRQSSLTELEDALLSQRVGVQRDIGLAGLNAANNQWSMQQSFQNQLLGNLLGGLFG